MASFVTRSNTLLSRMSAYQRALGRRVESALGEGGAFLLVEAIKLVPRDTEALKDSGRVSKIGSLFDTVIVVGFGGKDFPPRTEYSHKEGKVVTRVPHDYTVYVHENVNAVHSPGQANFLANPRYTKVSEIIEVINMELKR